MYSQITLISKLRIMVEFHAWVTVVFYSKWKDMVIYTVPSRHFGSQMTLRVCKFYWWVESVWLLLHKFWSHFGIFEVKYHNEKSQTDFPARGPGMYNTLSWGIHEVAVAVRGPGKLISMMAFDQNLPSSCFVVQCNSFITSTLKSLAIHAIWLALSSVIYS